MAQTKMLATIWREGPRVSIKVMTKFRKGPMMFFTSTKTRTMLVPRMPLRAKPIAVRAVMKMDAIAVMVQKMVELAVRGTRMGLGGGFSARQMTPWTTSRMTKVGSETA